MASTEKSSSRAWLIARRWLTIIFVGLLTLPTGLLLGLWQHKQFDRLAHLPRWTVPALVLMLVAIAAARPRRAAAALGLRHGAQYPPVSLGFAAGIWGALLLVRHHVISDFRFDDEDAELLKSSIIGLSVWLTVVPLTSLAYLGVRAIVHAFRRHRANKQAMDRTAKVAKEPVRIPGDSLSIARLRKWIATDETPKSIVDDLFAHQSIARRVCDRLLTKQPSAQAVVGPLGSGKSTLRTFVEELVQQRNSTTSPAIEIITIELWPYETARAAVEGIVATLVDSLSTRVGTYQLRGLPDRYGDAIGKAGGELAVAIARLRETPSSPLEMLRVIDNIAVTIGVRYVLWVEDLERFAVGDPRRAVADSSEAEKLAPIRALLFGLDRFAAISVITATTDLLRRFDLEKVARYIERIPPMSPAIVLKIIRAFRETWLAADFIDPGHDARDACGWDAGDEHWLVQALLGERIDSLADATLALCDSPRTLKFVLRRVEETWSRLQGEIDLDEVIALSALREAAPDAFSVLDRHSHSLRHASSGASRGQPSPMHDFLEELDKATEPGRVRDATRLIAQKVFSRSARLQSVGQPAHADYWGRFLTIPHLEDAVRDQRVLRAMKDDAKIVEMLANDDDAAAVSHFASLVDAKRLPTLITKVAQARAQDPPGIWKGFNKAPGSIPLWQMCLVAKDRRTLDMARIADAVRASFPVVVHRIPLLQTLEYWFTARGDNVPNIVPRDQRELLRQECCDLLASTYTNQEAKLAKAMEGSADFTLQYLVFGGDRVHEKRIFEEPFDGWEPFANTVLLAAIDHPSVVLPQLAQLITSETGDIEKTTWTYDERKATALFRDVPFLLDVFLEPGSMNVQQKHVIAVRTAAHRNRDAMNRRAFLELLSRRGVSVRASNTRS
jgi:hypothetical protein